MYIRHSKLFHCQISIKSISIIIVTIFLLSIFYAINIAPRAYSRQSNDGVLTSNDTIDGVTARWHSYTNSTYGVSLLYPPDWILSQVSQPNGTNNTAYEIMNLAPPISQDQNASTTFAVGIDNITRRVTPTLDQYLLDVINNYRSNTNVTDFKVIKAGTNVTIGGEPGYVLYYAEKLRSEPSRTYLEAGTIVGDTIYYLTIGSAVSDKQFTTVLLPQVMQIIKSFQIVSSNTLLSSPSNKNPINITNLQPNSTNYSLIKTWGNNGTADGQFNSPRGIAFDSNISKVYVADTSNNRIQKFDSNGNFITKWGTNGTGNGQLDGPILLAIDDRRGNVFVAEYNNHRIQKFDSNGNFITKWGLSGIDDGQFNSVVGVAVDSSQNLYVTDSGLDRVQKFDSNGNFITKWGTNGTGNGQFDGSFGIVVDPKTGNVFVADSGNNRIQKFDSNGNFITKFGTNGTENGQLDAPVGITVDQKTGNVYVSDQNNNRIQEFGIVNRTGESTTSNTVNSTTTQQQPTSLPQITQQTQQSTANFSQYQSPNFGFTITYPVNWTAKEYPQGVAFTTKQSPYARINVNVTENKTFENMKLNDYTDARINQLRGEFKGFHLEGENDTILSGKQGHYLIFSFVKNSSVMAATTGYTIVGDRVYEVAAITPYTNFSNIITIFKTIKDSLNIYNVSSPTSSGNTESNNQNQTFGFRG